MGRAFSDRCEMAADEFSDAGWLVVGVLVADWLLVEVPGSNAGDFGMVGCGSVGSCGDLRGTPGFDEVSGAGFARSFSLRSLFGDEEVEMNGCFPVPKALAGLASAVAPADEVVLAPLLSLSGDVLLGERLGDRGLRLGDRVGASPSL